MMNSIKSSYTLDNINFGDIIQLITWSIKPKLIVEFGILEGYSLVNFIKEGQDCSIHSYDIFESFNGNYAKREIIEKFRDYKNVKIDEGDFFKKILEYPDESIDIIHIDIANDGYTYEFAIQNCMKKLIKGGILMMEGGSKERDNINWMIKYNKVSIVNTLNKYRDAYNIFTIEKFPSMTFIRNKLV
jgi:predicted O-methyltransferase YrrM